MPPPDPLHCSNQGEGGPTCGTSLNLMKRLLYAQIAYQPAYARLVDVRVTLAPAIAGRVHGCDVLASVPLLQFRERLVRRQQQPVAHRHDAGGCQALVGGVAQRPRRPHRNSRARP
jgi:hypothetical protein